MKIRFVFLVFLLISVVCLGNNSTFSQQQRLDADSPVQPLEMEPIIPQDNVLVFAPHPDDETLGCAGVIQKAVKAGASVHVAYLTNGDSNQLAFIVYEKRLVFKKKAFIYLGEVRRKEATAAMKSLGVPQGNLIFLGYPDFGTMAIFKNYWNVKKPYHSLLTRVSAVPYPENFSYGKPYTAESVLADVKDILNKIKPNKIFITAPVDTNADHRAFYLFLRLALMDLGEGFSKDLRVYPYLVHHYNWPRPRHYHPELRLSPPPDMQKPDYQWRSLELSQEEIKNKHQAVLAYKSQTESSAFYLLSFVRKNELFLSPPEITLKDTDSDQNQVWSSRFDTMTFREESGNYQVNEEELDNSPVSFARKKNNFWIKITPSKQQFITSFSIYLFGYKKQIPFSQMPKMRLKIIGDSISIWSGSKKLEIEGLLLQHQEKDIIIKLPLSLLNEPEAIFCSVNSSLRTLSYDSNAWVIINL